MKKMLFSNIFLYKNVFLEYFINKELQAGVKSEVGLLQKKKRVK